jgi:hypothetical protein
VLLLAAACTSGPRSEPGPRPGTGGAAGAGEPAAERVAAVAGVVAPPETSAAEPQVRGPEARYVKEEHMVPMRDGVRLFTAVYRPRRAAGPRPIMMLRTPYSCRPYGPDRYRDSLGPGRGFEDAEFIFVYQDVRGRYLSEGEFVNMRPHVDHKTSASDVDESSDTWDTIEWLLANVEGHNGRVGMWGISYPGFYAAAGMIDAHPALRAVSPQAPIADWYFDDFHHHGALFLPHSFNFLSGFGRARPGPTTEGSRGFDHPTPDGYSFFLGLGSLANVNRRHFHHEVAFWDELAAHPDYDGFWQARNILPHLNRVAPAVMTVGGLFDAEDLYGPLKIYRAVERRNPGAFNVLVMGPWSHGGWSRTEGAHLGNVSFGAPTSPGYQRDVELPFFRHFLEDHDTLDLPEAMVFDTGALAWRRFEQWPPPQGQRRALHLGPAGSLSFAPAAGEAWDGYTSDPNRPVPFTEAITTRMTREYMTDDQRFASRRPDVLSYQTGALDADVTLAGPLVAHLWVSTSAGDADWVVKLIDVFPPDAPDHDRLARGQHMGEYQMMVRSEVFRGRYRDSYARPRPFEPGVPALVQVELQDVLHTFKAGHRIMVQVQSTWFPLVDRNPQRFVPNIFEADDDDFIAAEHRVHRGPAHPSLIEANVLDAP